MNIDISAEPAAPPEAGVKVHVRRGEDMGYLQCSKCNSKLVAWSIAKNDVLVQDTYLCPGCGDVSHVVSKRKPPVRLTLDSIDEEADQHDG